MSNKKIDSELKIREKAEQIKSSIENGTVRFGSLSVKLTSVLIYLCCLLAALFIWFNVSESNADTITREFSGILVSVEGESSLSKKNMAVFDGFEQVVSVTVEGIRARVDNLSEEDIVAYINVGNIDEAGVAKLEVSVKGTGKLDAVVSPASVKVYVDHVDDIDVPVTVNKTYSIVSDYDFDIRTDVETINVTGAKSVIEKVASARADADLGELTSGFSTTAPISLVDESGNVIDSKYITPEISRVIVYVDVYTEKTVPLAVTYKYGYIQSKNISVSVTPSEITLKGDPIVLAGIDSIDLPEIDETKLTGDTVRVVSVNLPSGVTDVNNTENFTEEIKLSNLGKSSISFPTSKISVINPHGVTYEFVDKNFEIEFVADNSILNKIKAEDFKVEVTFSRFTQDFNGKFGIYLVITPNKEGYTLYPINVGQIMVDFGTAEENNG